MKLNRIIKNRKMVKDITKMFRRCRLGLSTRTLEEKQEYIRSKFDVKRKLRIKYERCNRSKYNEMLLTKHIDRCIRRA